MPIPNGAPAYLQQTERRLLKQRLAPTPTLEFEFQACRPSRRVPSFAGTTAKKNDDTALRTG